MFFIFFDGSFYWCEMFLVAYVDVIQQRTFTRQKCATNFKTLCMPVLTFLLLRRRIKRHILLHLNYETNFRAVTEVTDAQV
jgi:hypothetical protein